MAPKILKLKFIYGAHLKKTTCVYQSAVQKVEWKKTNKQTKKGYR